ncbi:aspartyl protease family protein [uncultured Dokdonia sp.]|uniref:aspartyl protease family protein n=1 Tax=uncultured Dokdonia sp. TaxID=575653 RepID=UPI00261753A9|nr:aspartyl protease family protein [uncultured Dokdonia sp.]
MNWTTIKTLFILNKGTVEQKEYNIQIPFEYKLGLIFIDVKIDGSTYKFMLDSGSSNVISKDLAEKLNLQSANKNNVEDSKGVSSDFDFTVIEKIGIGQLNYLDTGAAIIDLDESDDIACLNIDGLIGANLMKKSIWKIDYTTKMIQISNDINSFEVPDGNKKIPMFTELTGSPIVDLLVDKTEEKNVIVDLGSNAGFSLSMDTYNALVNDNPAMVKRSSYGLSSSALNGNNFITTTFHEVLTNTISFGEVSLKDTHVKFSEDDKVSTIGSEFLENYDVIINWPDYEIILIKKKESSTLETSSYGFGYRYSNNNIVIDKLLNNSKAEKEGLKINDRIIRINNTFFDKVLVSEWCHILQNGLFDENSDTIELVILRGDKELTFNLTKEVLF